MLNQHRLIFTFASIVTAMATTCCQAGVIFSTNYTTAEGYPLNAPLVEHPDWAGGDRVRSRSENPGFVRNSTRPSTQPTFNLHGARPAAMASGFQLGDQIKIEAHLQVAVAGPDAAQELAWFGFSSSPTAPTLEQGFSVVWDRGFGSPQESGALRFYPDLNDYVLSDVPQSSSVQSAFSIQGRFVGLDVYNTQGQGPDFRSNQFLFSYTAEKISSTSWDVVDLSIRDLNSGANFFYDRRTQGPQLFSFTGDNAYFGQRLAVQGQNIDNATARSNSLTYSFIPANPVPEPSSLVTFALLSMFGCAPTRRRRRQK